MTDEQFYHLMAALGFGFGTLFWTAVSYLVFAWRGNQ